MVRAGAAEVRTYIAENLAAPQASELRNVTRQTADGLSETVTYPEVAQHAALPALHQAMVERWHG